MEKESKIRIAIGTIIIILLLMIWGSGIFFAKDSTPDIDRIKQHVYSVNDSENKNVEPEQKVAQVEAELNSTANAAAINSPAAKKTAAPQKQVSSNPAQPKKAAAAKKTVVNQTAKPNPKSAAVKKASAAKKIKVTVKEAEIVDDDDEDNYRAPTFEEFMSGKYEHHKVDDKK